MVGKADLTDIQTNPAARIRLSQRDLGLLFYIGVPTAFGLSLGWQGAGVMAGTFSKPVSLVYWLGAANLVWISLELGTRFVSLIAPKGKTPLLILLVGGALVQPLFGRPLLSFWQSLFIGFLPADAVQPALHYIFTSLGEYGRIVMANTFIFGVWVAFNFLFDRFLGYPRFRKTTGYAPREKHDSSDTPASTDPTPEVPLAPSGLILRLPQELGQNVIALSAEDHYVRVHTPKGNDLVLYRFKDAVREMPEEKGLQVHRSHWISQSAISRFEEAGRGYQVVLNDSIMIPVSQRYIEVLKARGFSPDRKQHS